MTREEMEELKGLAASMGLYDDKNPCKRAVILGKAIQELEQESKTGHWIVDSATSSRIGIHGKETFSYEVHCDKCGWKWAYTTDHKDSLTSKFCPNCGEKKEGEETE